MADPQWEEVIKGRKAAGVELPHLLRLPLVPDARGLLAGLIKDGGSLLDIGANNRNLERFLSEKGLNVKYSSCDTDRSFQHDYYDINSVQGTFDVVTALEVIEHMKVADVLGYFKAVRGLLNKGGVFLVSTPNVCHPVVFWRDCTHVSPFRYDELYGLLKSTGFEDIKVYRTGRFSLKNRIVALLYRPLLRLLRMDFAPGIAVVARPGG